VRRKGLELPVNMIIVIAIAVLVLVVVAAFFSGSFIRGTDTTKYQSAIANACISWRQTQGTPCALDFRLRVPGVTPDPDITTACSKAYPDVTDYMDSCRRLCSCP